MNWVTPYFNSWGYQQWGAPQGKGVQAKVKHPTHTWRTAKGECKENQIQGHSTRRENHHPGHHHHRWLTAATGKRRTQLVIQICTNKIVQELFKHRIFIGLQHNIAGITKPLNQLIANLANKQKPAKSINKENALARVTKSKNLQLFKQSLTIDQTDNSKKYHTLEKNAKSADLIQPRSQYHTRTIIHAPPGSFYNHSFDSLRPRKLPLVQTHTQSGPSNGW